MVQYRDLNAPPARALAEIVADMRASERQSKTGDAGVKDLGEAGDIVWPRWDGGEDSVREVSANVEAARDSIQELNEVILPDLADELETSRTDLQQKLDAANARIDDIIVDGGGAGNFTTYSINPPSGDGTGEGDQWFRVVNGEVIGQWRWDGSVWQPVTLTDAIIAGIDLSKLVSNGNLSEVVANKMFADLFAANKITAQELAVGAVTAENIASGAIHADEIVGGSFTGETFEGGTFTGGLFKTSDALPGRVTFADGAYVPSWGAAGQVYPGLRVEPIDTSATSVPPGIGSYGDGVIVDGGKSVSGGSSYIIANPTASLMRTFRENGAIGGVIQTSPTQSLVRTYREDGTVGGESLMEPGFAQMTARASGNTRGVLYASPTNAYIRTVNASNVTTGRLHADATESYIYSSAGGSQRYLTVDSTGVWVKTNKSGSWEWYNLEETANDTGWRNFSINSGLTLNDQTAWRNKGGIIWLSGRVRDNWAVGEWTTIATLPPETRPSRNIRATAPIDGRPAHLLEVNTAGQLRFYRPPNESAVEWSVSISTLTWPVG